MFLSSNNSGLVQVFQLDWSPLVTFFPPLYYWMVHNYLHCWGFGLLLNNVILCLFFSSLQFLRVCVHNRRWQIFTQQSSLLTSPNLLYILSSLSLLDVASLHTWLVSSFLIKAVLQFTQTVLISSFLAFFCFLLCGSLQSACSVCITLWTDICQVSSCPFKKNSSDSAYGLAVNRCLCLISVSIFGF